MSVVTAQQKLYLRKYVFKCIETWKCKNKLIAQTYDGAAMMAGELNGLQARVRENMNRRSLFIVALMY